MSNVTSWSCNNSNVSKTDEFTTAFLVLGSLYFMVFLMAIVGNSIVIYIVMKNSRMQTVTNIFIANLAASDLMVLSSGWVTPAYAYQGSWTFGKSVCYVCPLFQGSSIFISTLTLTAIALDRYFAIVHPLKARLSCGCTFFLMISIWTVSFLLVTPYAISMKYEVEECTVLCYENWEVQELRHIYGVVVTAIQYGLPFVVITFCYTSICRKLWQRPRKPSIAVGYRTAKKRRMVRMLIWMVVIFALCWAPINIGNIIRDNYPVLVDNRNFPIIFLATHLIAVSATCWNPILYGFMNKNFQREFLMVLPFASRSSLELSLSTNLLRKGSEMSSRRSTSRRSRNSLKAENYQKSNERVDSGTSL